MYKDELKIGYPDMVNPGGKSASRKSTDCSETADRTAITAYSIKRLDPLGQP